MGNYALFFLLMGVLFLPAGCSKQEPAAPRASVPAVTAAAVTTAVAEEPEIPAAAGFGYPLRVGMWLYIIPPENDTGAQTDVVKAAESIPLGEELQLVSAEPRKATNPYDNRVYDYLRVRRDTGREGLIFANQLTVGSTLAVVSDEKANLYRSAKNVDVSDNILSRKTVLGVFPETERDGFIQIEAYDPVSQAYRRNLFVKTSSISYSDADVQSSILLQTAEGLDPEKEKNRREALLDSALYDYPGSIFAADIRALVAPDSVAAARKIEAWYQVIDTGVNVREGPNVLSKVVIQFEDTPAVLAVEETVDEFSIEGQTARWYRISNPVEGWIFGAWLEDAK
jgi:hypothetical protein